MLSVYSSASNDDKQMQSTSVEDPVFQKKRVLDDVKNLKVDNLRRMESIEVSIIPWMVS